MPPTGGVGTATPIQKISSPLFRPTQKGRRDALGEGSGEAGVEGGGAMEFAKCHG